MREINYIYAILCPTGSRKFHVVVLVVFLSLGSCFKSSIGIQDSLESHMSYIYICHMFFYSGHALSYTKLVHRHATETEGNKCAP